MLPHESPRSVAQSVRLVAGVHCTSPKPTDMFPSSKSCHTPGFIHDSLSMFPSIPHTALSVHPRSKKYSAIYFALSNASERESDLFEEIIAIY